MKLSLVVTSGKPEGKEIPIRLSQFVIGRDPECHLRPASPLISKRHCAVIIREERAFLRDFNSTNGTIVNKEALKGEVELKNGDEFAVGPLTFRVKLQAGITDTPTPVPPTGTPIPATATPEPAKKVPAESRVTSSKSPASAADEDLVMEMLLNLEGAAAEGGANDPIPPGSTIMQIISAAAPEEEKKEEAKPDPKKDNKKKISDPQATSNAAKAILDKYMRRPRA